jgi:integrase
LPTPYVFRRPTGLFVRFLIPHDFRGVLGQRFILRKLPSRPAEARVVAAWLGLALSRVFTLKRSGVDVDLKKALEAAQRAVEFKGKDVRLPNGVSFGELQIDTPEDAALFQKTFGVGIESIGVMPQAPALPAVPLNSPLVSEQVALFVGDLKRAHRSLKSIEEARFSLTLFVALVGDRRVAEVTSHDVRRFMDLLEHYPSNASKSKAFAGLTPLEIVEKAKRQKVAGLSARTQHKHFEKIRAFFNACVSQDLLPKSPCEAIPLQKKEDVQRATRAAFTANELAKIFGSTWLPWGEGKPHRRWGVLLGLFSGARVNEVAQLLVTDIEEVTKIWGFHVRTKSKTQRVKNNSSRRFVPIPKRLIDLGFLDYVRSLPEDSMLFPKLPYCPVNGYGDALSDQFGRYLKAIGVKGEAGKVSFHSWRHSFISRCAGELGVNETLISTVTGHALSGPGAMAKYLKKAPLTEAKKVVDAHADLYKEMEL